MAAAGSQKLYTPRLLALSASLAAFPMAREFDRSAAGRSRTCGSEIALGIDIDADGMVTALGMQVSACAVGQSSAAIMAASAQGRRLEDFGFAHDQITAWLDNGGPLPDWPGFDALEAVRHHPSRRGALMMAWEAMIRALST